MKADIKLSLARLVPLGLLALIRNVIAKMTGNALFPTPAVSLADLGTAADDLEAAIAEATYGSRQSRLTRDDLVLQGKQLLRKQADYVRSICLGDAAKLDSSGFTLRRQPQHIGIPAAPVKLLVVPTPQEGHLQIRWPRVEGARMYKLLRTLEDPTKSDHWEQVTLTTRARYIDAGLASFTPCWYAAVSVGTDGESDKSAPAMGRPM